MGKFDDVTDDKDTKILRQEEKKLGTYDILYQKWRWDGITAESVIFASIDVAELSDSELEKIVRDFPSLNMESQVTIKRSESGFTFVNFNFKM